MPRVPRSEPAARKRTARPLRAAAEAPRAEAAGRGARAAPATAEAPRARARLLVDERRTQLLALGLRVFGERAYDEVSVDDLARAAGVSKGLLYHYFPTKRDFYVAAVAHAAEGLLEVTIAQAPDAAPLERVERGLATYLDFVEQHAAAYLTLMGGGVGVDPEVAAILERTRATFVSRILAQVPGELPGPLPTLALRGWVGFVEAVSLDWVASRAVPRAEVVHLCAQTLFLAVLAAGRGDGLQGPG